MVEPPFAVFHRDVVILRLYPKLLLKAVYHLDETINLLRPLSPLWYVTLHTMERNVFKVSVFLRQKCEDV